MLQKMECSRDLKAPEIGMLQRLYCFRDWNAPANGMLQRLECFRDWNAPAEETNQAESSDIMMHESNQQRGAKAQIVVRSAVG